MVTALLVAIALPWQEPDVRIELDRDEVHVGDVVQLNVVATGADHDATDIADQPQFDGFSVVGMTRSSVVNYRGAQGVRTTTWLYQLRAAAAGSFMLGPIRVTVGDRELTSERIGIRVSAAGEAADEGLAERLRRIVRFAPGPDGTDQVIVSVVPSTDTIVLGDQLDLLVVAWFPRDVRTRLRTRPTLTPPELTGAWSYSQTAALGVLSSRNVAGRMYDLFVHHQVVFPLTPGRFEVGAASVTYNLPLRTSILSREIPQEIQSRPTAVTVLPQPAGGHREGAAARGLRLDVAVDTNRFAAGEAATLVASLRGRGNVALWPEPTIDWPRGLRVYPGQTEIHIDSDSGIVSGTKSFAYLLVADSVGTYNIPPPTFAYFDLDVRRVRTATAPAFRLVSRVDREGVAVADPAVRVMRPIGLSPAERLYAQIPRWGWWLLLGVPPLFALAVRGAVRWRRRERPVPTQPGTREGLAALDESFRNALRDLVPDAPVREGDRLAAALTAAGVEGPVSVHAARVRDRLRHAVYGPGGGADEEELVAEVREVLNALPRARSVRSRVLGTVAVAVLALLVGSAGPLQGQGTSAEQLFEAGSFRQAADSFAARAARAPREPANWVNLGYALEAAGQPARARVAWLRAARLQPRDPQVRSALRAGPSPDPASRRLTRVFWVTPFEALLAATGLWLVTWVLVAAGMPVGRVLVAATLAAVAGAYGWQVLEQYHRPTALVVTPSAPVRTAPHGSASPARQLSEGTAVRIDRQEGAWLLISREGTSGWVLAEEVARI